MSAEQSREEVLCSASNGEPNQEQELDNEVSNRGDI